MPAGLVMVILFVVAIASLLNTSERSKPDRSQSYQGCLFLIALRTHKALRREIPPPAT